MGLRNLFSPRFMFRSHLGWFCVADEGYKTSSYCPYWASPCAWHPEKPDGPLVYRSTDR